jgi:hypothetical protein
MALLVILFLCLFTFAFALFGGGTNGAKALQKKILDLSDSVNRGLSETPADREQVQKWFYELAKLDPTKGKALSDKDLSGTWLLRYTTSDSILGRGKSPRVGPIRQMLDTTGLRAANSEIVDYKLFKLPRKVVAELDPQGPSLTNVYFKEFTIGKILKIKAPDKFRGTLDVNYLNKDFRLSIGDKGSLFVLTKESNNIDPDNL